MIISSSITESDQLERAFNLGLAAILGKGVYNFGELVRMTSILVSFFNSLVVDKYRKNPQFFKVLCQTQFF